MEIKHPRAGDVLPIPLEFQKFDPDWVWIMGNAILIAAPAHDMILLLRLVKWGEMPNLWLHRLFQHVLKEVKARGYRGYMAWLANDVAEEKKLLEIAHRAGAYFEPFKGDLAVGPL